MGQDYYSILNITPSGTTKDVNKAYRKLALKYHPQKNPGKQEAEDKFNLLAEAYDVLSDPRKRAVYDQFGEEGLKCGVPEGSGQAGAWNWGYTFHGNAEKVFRDFMGSENPFQEYIDRLDGDLHMGAGGLHNRGVKKQDPPIERDLYLTLEEIYHGCIKKMKISRRVMHDDGHTSSIRDKILTIVVKKGWQEGTKVIFKQEGDQGPNNTPADIVFIVRDKPHPRFKRDGLNLVYVADIPLGKALIGYWVDIHTLDDRILHVPITDIVRPSFVKVVPGEGMPHTSAPSEKGDLHIHFNVEVPKTLTPAQKKTIGKTLP